MILPVRVPSQYNPFTFSHHFKFLNNWSKLTRQLSRLTFDTLFQAPIVTISSKRWSWVSWQLLRPRKRIGIGKGKRTHRWMGKSPNGIVILSQIPRRWWKKRILTRNERFARWAVVGHWVDISFQQSNWRTWNWNNITKWNTQNKSDDILILIFILTDNPSRYLSFKDVEHILIKITHRRIVGTYPHSSGTPIIHHRMKVSLNTLNKALIWI
jgi:hypothetical protein